MTLVLAIASQTVSASDETADVTPPACAHCLFEDWIVWGAHCPANTETVVITRAPFAA